MATYNYTALDARGREQKGALEVPSQFEAINRIKAMGYFPTRISPIRQQKKEFPTPQRAAGRGAGRWDWRRTSWGKPVNRMDLAYFTRQLATLIEAGMPLVRGLRLLARQESNSGFKRIIQHLEESIEGGSTFSEAVAHHPRVFNHLYVGMVKAGEMGGDPRYHAGSVGRVHGKESEDQGQDRSGHVLSVCGAHRRYGHSHRVDDLGGASV